MTRIDTILLKARDVLADHSKQRWSDDLLIRLISEGQKDIAVHSRIVKASYVFNLQEGVHTYTLPDDVWLITRASDEKGCKISLISYDSMDTWTQQATLSNRQDSNQQAYYRNNYWVSPDSCWELDTANEVAALVYDNRNLNTIRVYPIPTDINTTIYTQDDPFGVLVDLTDYLVPNVFGVTTDILDSLIASESFNSVYGVVTSIGETDKSITLWYIKTLGEVEAATDTLEIPPMFDKALRYYIIAHAFLIDNDAAFQAKAGDFMNLYERELAVAKDTQSVDGVRSPTVTQPSYRGPF